MRQLILCDDGDVAAVAPLCRRYGLGIEVQEFCDLGSSSRAPLDALLSDRDPDAIDRHRDAVAGLPLVAVHGPFADLCAGSFDPMVREITRNRFEIAYRVARELGATDVVLHHGHVPSASPPARWLARWVAFWREFLDGKSGVRFHVENVADHTPTLLRDVVRELASPDVDICLDIGHTHCFSRTAAVEWIEKLGDLIGYVHLHDNDGSGDQHLGLGEGTMPLPEVFAALERHAPQAIWALETQTAALESSIAWLGSITGRVGEAR